MLFLEPTSTKQWDFLLKELMGAFDDAQAHDWLIVSEKRYKYSSLSFEI